jgi:hypothetical protein
MPVTSESLSSYLSSTFNIPFSCRLIDERSCRFEIAIAPFNPTTSFSVDCYRPYKDSCRSSLTLGDFSRRLLSQWGRDSNRLGEAYYFAKTLSSKIDFKISILGNTVTDPITLADAINDVQSSGDITIGCICRDIPQADEDEYFYLTAIACMGFGLIASSIFDDQDPAIEAGEYEGAYSETIISRRERSRSNRARCIAHYGTTCQVCGFDFGKTYGQFAKGHIEVHHITPLSTLDEPSQINPVRDLIPLCPNCHAAVHLTTPPIHPDKLRELVEQHRLGGHIG